MTGNKYNSIIRSKILNDFSKVPSQKEISLKYLVHKFTICRIIKSGDINVCHRLATAREDRKVAVFFKKNPVATAKEAKNDLY